MAAGDLKQKLTAQLESILSKYDGCVFNAKLRHSVIRDCEDFLISLGIQRALFPKISVTIDPDGIMDVVFSDYPKQDLKKN